MFERLGNLYKMAIEENPKKSKSFEIFQKGHRRKSKEIQIKRPTFLVNIDEYVLRRMLILMFFLRKHFFLSENAFKQLDP